MANDDAVSALLRGGEEWGNYASRSSGMVDLTFAQLAEVDLGGRAFRNCNLTGAQLNGANLDACIFDSCLLNGTNLSNASLVRARLRNLDSRQVIAANAVIREATLEWVQIADLNLSSAILDSCRIHDCTTAGVRSDSVKIYSCTFDRCNISDFKAEFLLLRACKFTTCELSDWDIEEVLIDDSSFRNSGVARLRALRGDIRQTAFLGCRITTLVDDASSLHVESLDLSGSTVASTDLRLIGLSTASLLDTAFVNCRWPDRYGRVSPTGQYVPSDLLPRQPIQDVKGVPPVTRRDIADAQFLVRKTASGSLGGRVGMRIWGLCTGFGQSLSRLSITTLVVISIAALSLLVARQQMFGDTLDLRLLWGAFRDSGEAFFALRDFPRISGSAEVVITLAVRIAGFLVLGLWIAIASSKLNKLGSE